MRRLITIKTDMLKFWRNLIGALGFVWQASPGWTLASVGLQILLGLIPLASLYLLKQIVDTVARAYEEKSGAAAFEEVFIFIILAGVVAFLSAALSVIAELVKDAQENVVTDFMYQIIHDKAIAMDLEHYENPTYNDILHRIQEEAPFLPSQILQSLLQGAQNLISLLVIAGWLFWFDWMIVPILLLVAIPKVLVNLRYADEEHALDIHHTPLERQAWYLHELLTTDSKAKEIRLFSIGKVLNKRFQQIRKQLRTEELSFDRQWFLIRLMGEILPTLGVFGILCFVAYRTSLGWLTVGDLVVAFQAIQRGHVFMQGLLGSVTDLYENNLFVKNVYEFLSIKPRLVGPSMSKPIPHPLERGIGFHHVSFHYPGDKRKILNDVSLEIRPGEHIALVGENGAGKTSLVKLLCRLYDPTHGKLTFDGIDLRDFSVEDVSEFVGKVLNKRFQQIRKQLRTEELSFDRQWFLIRLMGEILPTLGVFGILCFVAYRTSLGWLTVGDLVVAFQAIQRGHVFMQGLLGSVTDLYENNLFVKNVYEFLSIKPRLVGPSMSKPIPHPLERGIGFHHVSFHYPGDKRKILNDVSLEIRPGEHIALVGENGAGKTSLVKLLCRLYDPTHGKLTFDGIDLRDFSVEDVRRQVSIMFQDYVQYHLSARENIWLGDTSFPLESERIEAAVKQAGAQGIFKKLSAGYDTILGRRFEGGEELSIGEWQKIALARAFFRDSGILVLDEPTSAMDARAEYELFQRFHSLTKGRTAILISHRLSSVKMVDRIYVLEHGKVVESGTHDELISLNSRYATFFEMQAEKYR